MKPKELSAKTGLKERTIRFYEEQGLLSPATTRRNGRTFREYTQEDVRQLKTIATLRRAGFTLEEIRSMLEGRAAADAIFPAYRQRIRQEAATAQRLMEAAEQVHPSGMDVHQLAERLERSAKYLDLPPADLEPHFGRLDPESPEEKQRAIAAYQAQQSKQARRLRPQTAAIILLSVLCLCLAIACGGLYLHLRPQATEPEPSGSTQGWLYYTELENGQYHLRRYQENGGAIETVYSSMERLAALTTPEKVYVSDGSTVYSMNADGSGRYLLAKNAAATGGSRAGEGSGRMAVYDGMLYLVDTTADLVAGGSALARIPLSGGELEPLDIYTGQDFNIYHGTLYADYFGAVTTLDLDTGAVTEHTMENYTGQCAMGDSYIFQLRGDSKYASRFTLTWVRQEADGSFTVSDPIELPDRTVSFYAHGARLYYTVVGVDGPDTLCAFDPETGETTLITELREYAPTLDVFFGENGFYVPYAVENCYFPYE